MATKLVKILQTESGPFTPTNNMLSIAMEPGNVTDLSKSYLHMEVNFLANGAVPEDSTIKLGNPDTKSQYSTAAIVKHATLRSDVVGLVEQQRFNNVYQETTRQFMESTENKRASVAFGNNEVQIDDTGLGHMLIPLDKLFGAAKSEQLYPDYRMGQSRIELELEDKNQLFYVDDTSDKGRFTVECNNLADVDDFDSVVVTQPFSAQAVSQYFVEGREYRLSFSVNGAQQAPVIVTIDNFVRAGNGIVTLTFVETVSTPPDANVTDISLQSDYQPSDNTYECENQDNATASAVTTNKVVVQAAYASSFPEGLLIQLGYISQTLGGIAPTDTYNVFVTKVSGAIQQGQNVQLTFNDSITIPAQSGLRQVFIFGKGEPQIITWTISKVELIQAKPLQQQKVDQFEFKTNLLENVNHPALVNEFRRQVQLDAGTDLVLCINPVLDPLLGGAQFDTYRNSLNSVDTITKDVQIDYTTNGSVYFDRLMYAYPELRKLQPLNGIVTVAMIPELIEPEQALEPQNIVEFRLRHTVGVPVIAGMLYFYKRLTKVL